jgi:hypothetical protein
MIPKRPLLRPLQVLAWTLGLLVLLTVFAWYAQPAMVFELAQQFWNCF